MKRTKKLAALILALAMAFSTLVMPAMAHGDDENIAPLGLVTKCRVCGKEAEAFINDRAERYDYIYAGTCSAYPADSHTHVLTGREYKYFCGHTFFYANTIYCNGANTYL